MRYFETSSAKNKMKVLNSFQDQATLKKICKKLNRSINIYLIFASTDPYSISYLAIYPTVWIASLPNSQPH